MKTPFRSTRRVLLGSAVLCASILSGCGALVVGGTAATTAIVATDRRTVGEQVEDQAIEMKVAAEMRRLFEDTARVNAASYAGLVLLTGDVPTEQAKQQAGEAAEKVEKVQRVVNELRVGEVTPISVRSNDTWLTSKVKTALINTREVPSRTINVTTERGVVYLLGKVTNDEGQRAAIAASGVRGVNKVVKLFHIVSPESLIDPLDNSAQPQQSAPASTPAETAPESEVQALPVQ